MGIAGLIFGIFGLLVSLAGIINTFLEKYDFANKKICLFATSGGSGWGKTADALRNRVDASCVIETTKVN